MKQLEKFTKRGKPLSSLSRFELLCQLLGNPQENLRFVHIAGTNGKGSVSEYIMSALMLSRQYERVGKFTSPYLVRVNERIQLDNKVISDTALEKITAIVILAAEKASEMMSGNLGYSQFEILTAAAFVFFSMAKTDIVVLEAGIGGTLDCTNIVTPEISVITAIGLDHCEILGGTTAEIAAHKAGIIKKNVPVVVYPGAPAVMNVFRKKAESLGAKFIAVPKNPDILRNDYSGTRFVDGKETYRTKMIGRHQVFNALTAIYALRELGVGSDSIRGGVSGATLPGRMQLLRTDPMIILDGAHNPQGMAAAAEIMRVSPVTKAAVVGMITGKDYKSAIRELLPSVGAVIFTDKFAPNSVPVAALEKAAVSTGFPPKCIFTVREPMSAVNFAAQLVSGGVVLVTGSLYLAGSLLK
ncbi:folylpolyglutamate synthase [Clostridia bacterium]|nr:folylpolyglutamate synthase [Clostridia bacterium]